MEQYIGKLLDSRYEIIERIGIGGMAVVYKARCHRLNRLVAVKILKDELAQDADFRRRFHDESQAVAMLSHPNIVAVYDVSRSSEIDYIVMELIDGITLKQYMQKRGGKLSWREALHFSTQIMKALSHAHSRGIIHRDIKPHNIMVLRDGSVKVADFGIARLTSAAQVTLTQEALGSVHYISPEQARGSHIDARSDIYSAGVVLYEMVTGRLPYEGDTPVSVAIQHINSIPLSPKEIDPDVPDAMESIIMKAMASRVDNRYMSADMMLADLEEFRKNPNINFEYTAEDLKSSGGDEPTQVLGANTTHGIRAQPAYHKDDTASGSRPRRRDYEEEDYEEPPRKKLPIILAICSIVILFVGIGAFLWTTVFSSIFTAAENHRVPDLNMLTLEEARAHRDVLAYEFSVVEEGQADSTLPEGQIISQRPDNTMKAARGATITVITSSGGELPPEETIPLLEKLDQRVAVNELAQRGIGSDKIILKEDYSDEITVGYVISQTPPSGTPISQVDEVVLVVSTGPKPKPVTIINFVGLTKEEAQQQADGLKIKISIASEEYSDTVEAGKITYQSIPVAGQINEGETVSLRISKGVEPGGGDVPENPDVPVTPPPSTLPTPEITPPPSTTPEGGDQLVATSRSVWVALPDDGRDAVLVEVSVGGNIQYSREANTSMGRVPVTIQGTKDQTVVVFIDGAQVDTYAFPHEG